MHECRKNYSKLIICGGDSWFEGERKFCNKTGLDRNLFYAVWACLLEWALQCHSSEISGLAEFIQFFEEEKIPYNPYACKNSLLGTCRLSFHVKYTVWITTLSLHKFSLLNQKPLNVQPTICLQNFNQVWTHTLHLGSEQIVCINLRVVCDNESVSKFQPYLVRRQGNICDHMKPIT